MQRLFDVFFSGMALVVLAPLLIPVALILRFTGEGEIFYIQERVGVNKMPFGLIKFATMLKDSPNIGSGEFTVQNDPRVLPFGRFLRKTKLNELPQIINIFKGDMSIVGPRPMVPKTFAHYGASGDTISQVRPGLTGVGSIVFRDEEKYLANHEDPTKFYFEVITPYKVQLELWYLKNQSLLVYFKLIILTAWVVIFSDSKLPEKWLVGKPAMPHELWLRGTGTF